MSILCVTHIRMPSHKCTSLIYLFPSAHYLLNTFCFSHLYYIFQHLFHTYSSLFRPDEPSLLHKHLTCTYRAYLYLFSLIFTYFDQISKTEVRWCTGPPNERHRDSFELKTLPYFSLGGGYWMLATSARPIRVLKVSHRSFKALRALLKDSTSRYGLLRLFPRISSFPRIISKIRWWETKLMARDAWWMIPSSTSRLSHFISYQTFRQGSSAWSSAQTVA